SGIGFGHVYAAGTGTQCDPVFCQSWPMLHSLTVLLRLGLVYTVMPGIFPTERGRSLPEASGYFLKRLRHFVASVLRGWQPERDRAAVVILRRMVQHWRRVQYQPHRAIYAAGVRPLGVYLHFRREFLAVNVNP